MNVLLVFPNINGCHEDIYHFGLASIVSATRRQGHAVRTFIVSAEEEIARLLEEINAFKPKVIGFTSVSSQFGYVKRISSLIKGRFPESIIVCGGVHPTIYADALLESKDIDGFFIRESEFSFTEFLAKIENNEPYAETDNFAYAHSGRIIRNRLKPLIEDLDILLPPDREVYPYGENIKKIGYAPFLFSRGCPYLCTYCSNHAIAKIYGKNRNSTRFRSPEACVREIEEVIRRHDIKIISIGDDIFGLDRQWRKEFCEKYKKRIKIQFMCLLRVELAEEELIGMLKEAGCYRIFFGVESGNEYIRREIMNRRMTNEEIIKAFDLCHQYGMQTLAVNIIGIPGETKEMIRDTIKLNRRLRPTTSAVNIYYPYKGTVLGERCFKEGLVDEERYNNFSNERRETVLGFNEKHKRLISYFYTHWEKLVYPYDLERHTRRLLKKIGMLTAARKIKRAFLFTISYSRK